MIPWVPHAGAVATVVRSDLRRRWRAWLLLGTLLGLTAGSAMAAAQGARRTDSAVARYSTWAQSFDLKPLPPEEVHRVIDADPDVLAVGRTFGLPPVFPVLDGKLARLRAVDAAVVGWDDAMGSVVDRPLVLEGRLPRPGRQEALVNDAWVERLGIGPGDTVLLASLAGAMHDDRLQNPGPLGFSPQYEADPTIATHVTVTVVGRALLSLTELAEDPAGRAAYLVVDKATAAELVEVDPAILEEDAPSFTVLSVRLRPQADPEVFQARLANVAGQAVPSVRADELRSLVQRQSRPYVVGLWVFAATAAVTALVLVGPAIARQAVNDASADVRLWELGAGAVIRSALVTSRAALVAFVAAAVAVAFAVAASGRFPVGPVARAEPDPGTAPDVGVLAAGVAAILIASIVISVVAVARMETVGEHAARRVRLVDRLASRLPIACSLGVRWALPRGGPSRRLMRSSTVVLSLSVAATATVTCFLAGLHDLLADPARYGWSWDAAVTAEQGWGILSDTEFGDTARSGGVAEWAFADFQFLPIAGGPVVPTIGLSPGLGDISGVTITAGRPPRRPDEVALGAVTMRQLGVGLGDRVPLTGSGAPPLLVVGRAVFSGLGKSDTPRATLGEGAAVLSSFETRFGIDDRTPLDVSNAAFVRFAPGGNAHELRAILTNHIVVEAAPPGVLEAWPELRSLLRGLLGLLGLLAVASVVHTLALSVRWRSGEMTSLRALGMTPGGLRVAVTSQALVLVGVASLSGALVGTATGRSAWSQFVRFLGLDSPLALSTADVVVPALVTAAAVAISVIAALRAIPAGCRNPMPQDGQSTAVPSHSLPRVRVR